MSKANTNEGWVERVEEDVIDKVDDVEAGRKVANSEGHLAVEIPQRVTRGGWATPARIGLSHYLPQGVYIVDVGMTDAAYYADKRG
jgi:hypothetical protein